LGLGVRAGDKVLDACAGRGQKSTLLAERLGTGKLVACDLYPEKLEALAVEATRPPQNFGEDVTTRVADLLEPAPFDAPELPSELVAGQTALRLLPGVHGTDGYFRACFRRR
jgi:16S rRNA C967 or C1407 C5-methylase (RsmB/RsmF family)